MTRQLYLHQLKEYLNGLPPEEQDSAMRYCEEYFDEAGEDQFDQAVRDLGTPKEFAAQIRRNYTSRMSAEGTSDIREPRERNWVLIIGLLLLAIPVLLPLFIVTVILACILLFLLILPVLILGFLLFVLFGVGAVLLRTLINSIFVSVSSAVLALGGFLIICALFLTALYFLILIVKKAMPWLAEKIQTISDRIRERMGKR